MWPSVVNLTWAAYMTLYERLPQRLHSYRARVRLRSALLLPVYDFFISITQSKDARFLSFPFVSTGACNTVPRLSLKPATMPLLLCSFAHRPVQLCSAQFCSRRRNTHKPTSYTTCIHALNNITVCYFSYTWSVVYRQAGNFPSTTKPKASLLLKNALISGA